MTQQEIYNYNNRCAEFLGYVNTTSTDKDFNIYENEKGMIIGNKIYTLLETMSMKFHSDWNWTHEVIRVIENIRDVRDVTINSVGCIIFHKEGAFSGFSDNKHEAVVEAINKFLIWYNENYKNTLV